MEGPSFNGNLHNDNFYDAAYKNLRAYLQLELHEEGSSSLPTDQQQLPLPEFNPASTNTLPPAHSVQSVAPPQHQATAEPAKPRPASKIDLSSTDPKKRGRGYTGRAKGRPPGSLNKIKDYVDDQPKTPKKRGRPPGSKNKRPREAHSVDAPEPDNNNGSITNGSQQPLAPTMTGPSLAMPMANQYPVGYAPVTDHTYYQAGYNAGLNDSNGNGYVEHILGHPVDKYSSVPPEAFNFSPEDIMTPGAGSNDPPMPSPYANLAHHGPFTNGYGPQAQLPTPPNSAVLGSSTFANNGNDNNSGNDSHAFPNAYLGAASSAYAQPPPPSPPMGFAAHALQPSSAPATSPAHGPSTTLTGADDVATLLHIDPALTLNSSLPPSTSGQQQQQQQQADMTDHDRAAEKGFVYSDWLIEEFCGP